MDLNDDIETEDEYIEDNYVDIEAELERQEPSERAIRALRNLANFYRSREQLANKGNLLGQYKSEGDLKTYIDVYEKAIIGKAEINGSKEAEDISFGYACLTDAIVEDGVLYLLMKDRRIYRLRNLKAAETIAYMINGKQLKTMNEGTE